jgi:hypothetical protein
MRESSTSKISPTMREKNAGEGTDGVRELFHTIAVELMKSEAQSNQPELAMYGKADKEKECC